MPTRASRPGALRGSEFVVFALLLGVIELVLLALWQRNGYWDFSDGVYADTARELLHGASLYHDVAAAQPPPVYLIGTLLLALHDGLTALRTGLALADLASAALVALAVWRLSGERWLALVAGLAAPLLPISLHEHAQLIPETLAAPLIMLGALFCARDRSTLGGVALALAAACKLAFVVPALAIVLVAVDRRRALSGLVGGGVVFAAAALVVYGTPLWTETVRAQFEVGGASLHYVAGLLAQAAWNELPLVLGTVVVLVACARGRGAVSSDAALLRALLAAALGGLLLGLTLFKRGSYISVFVVAEPPLLALACVGAHWLWRRHGTRTRMMVAIGTALLVAESASLLLAPTDPAVARRPGARSGLALVSSPAAVSRAVAAARRCPDALAYSGAPYLAFLADRRMPGQQPDIFILHYASADARFARRAGADQPRCPR